MNDDNILELVLEKVRDLLDEKEQVVSIDTPLVGPDSCLTSMKLVELCLALEDLAADLGFDFDWVSEAALSKSRSMFRTVRSLGEEFVAQMRS